MEPSAERDRVVPPAHDLRPRGGAVRVIGAALVCVNRRSDDRERLTRIAERVTGVCYNNTPVTDLATVRYRWR